MTRRERAIIIRDAILAWLPGRSSVQELGGVRWAVAAVGRFGISYRTPFTPMPAPPPDTFEGAALLQQRGGKTNLGYGMDVHAPGGKLMNIEWEPDGRVELVGFRGGDWEAELLALLKPH